MIRMPEDLPWESRLRSGLGVAPTPDFAAWCRRHAAATQFLNPVVTTRYRRNRRILMRSILAVAASLLVAVGVTWFQSGGSLDSSAFAQTIRGVNNAQTITWTTTFYGRVTSADGKRTWLTTERHLHAYRQPGNYRETVLNEAGEPWRVLITDARGGRELTLDLKAKKAALKAPMVPHDVRGTIRLGGRYAAGDPPGREID